MIIKEFQVGDCENSDGIGESEELIKKANGSVSRDFFITLPPKEETQTWYDAAAATDYLINEWDYALEEWRNSIPNIKAVKI